MTTLRFTLVAEGSSDRVLIPILRWMLGSHHSDFQWIGQAANLQELPKPPRELGEKIAIASKLFPADVIFVHRDVDRESPSKRREEIAEALRLLPNSPARYCVPVIPVRMTEAWLLISESALRTASGNPNGQNSLNLPPLSKLESIPDPKKLLQDLLLEASEHTGRRRKKFNFPARRARIPDFLKDLKVLLGLPSAKELFDEIAALDFSCID
jgi:hypothetical protein